MSVEHDGKILIRGEKTEVPLEKPVPLARFPPQISHRLASDRTRGSGLGRRWPNFWAV